MANMWADIGCPFIHSLRVFALQRGRPLSRLSDGGMFVCSGYVDILQPCP